MSETFHSLIGRVRDAKPNISFDKAGDYINDAIREVINRRTYWADLGYRGIISIPDAHTDGTVSTTRGSKQVVGSGTGWPVSDRINATLAEDVAGGGYEDAEISSGAGIEQDMILLVDAGTPSQEVVPVIKADGDIIRGQFLKAHNAGAAVTVSSLAGLQLRLGSGHPIFTVQAVIDAQTLLLDLPWGGPGLSDAAYQILMMYVTPVTNLRRMEFAIDQRQGYPIDVINLTQKSLSIMDPQRATSGDPRALVPMSPSAAGQQQWEIYPAPTSARQISFFCSRQWPTLVNPNDSPPPFLEPALFWKRAQAEALRIRVGGRDGNDPWYDPRMADTREREFRELLVVAMDNDSDRHSRDYQTHVNAMRGLLSPTYLMSHLPAEMWYEM